MFTAIVSALLGVLVFGFFLAGSDGGIFTFGHQIDALVAFLSTMAVALGILDLVAGTTAAIIRYKMNSGQYQQVKNNRPLSLGGHVESRGNKKLCFRTASLGQTRIQCEA